MTIFNLSLEELRRRNSVKWARFEPDVLPMFVAEMDCHIAEPVARRLTQAIDASDTGYPEGPLYQEAFANFARDLWQWQIDGAQLKLAGDVMQGIRELVLTLTEPGDAIVINTPVYPPIRNTCHFTGRRIIDVPMTDDARLDLDRLEAAFAGELAAQGSDSAIKPTAYLLCSPHNPHGTLHTRAELQRVAELADRHDVAVIADEIHAPLAGAEHVPFVSLPGAERSFVVTSASKSWNLAGMKAALIAGGPQTVQTLAAMPAVVSESASWFGILAHSTALTEGRQWLAEASAEITENKRFLAEELKAKLGLDYEPSASTYLAWVDCSPLGLENPGQHFHEHARVRFSFGTEFDPQATQFVRINAGTSPEIVSEAVTRMANSVQP